MPEFASNWTRDADAPMGCGSAMANAAEAAREESRETIAQLTAERDEAQKALLDLTCSGSEFFSRKGDRYVVDAPACVTYIKRARDDRRELVKRTIRNLRAAEAARQQSAETIARLERENARLREALEPFARYAAHLPDGFDGEIGELYVDGLRVSISYAAIRAAARALSPEGGGNGASLTRPGYSASPEPSGLGPSGEYPSRIALETIARTLQWWCDYDQRKREAEGLTTLAETHIMAPPSWPTHGQLRAWINALHRAQSALGRAADYLGAATYAVGQISQGEAYALLRSWESEFRCPACMDGECTAGAGCLDYAEQDEAILTDERAALASVTEARRAETQSGSVHEGAVPKADAHSSPEGGG